MDRVCRDAMMQPLERWFIVGMSCFFLFFWPQCVFAPRGLFSTVPSLKGKMVADRGLISPCGRARIVVANKGLHPPWLTLRLRSPPAAPLYSHCHGSHLPVDTQSLALQPPPASPPTAHTGTHTVNIGNTTQDKAKLH